LNSEEKSSSYGETDLAPMDHAATSNTDMLESNKNVAVIVNTDHHVEPKAGWLFCMQRRVDVVGKMLCAMIAICPIVIVYYLVSPILSLPRVTQVKAGCVMSCQILSCLFP